MRHSEARGLLDVVVVGKSTCGDHADIGVHLAQGADGRRTVHQRHHHIREHDGNLRSASRIGNHGFDAIGGEDRAIAERFERLLCDLANGSFIIDGEDKFIVAAWQTARGFHRALVG